MSHVFKICYSPYKPPIETRCNIVFTGVQYSEDEIHLNINPDVSEYTESQQIGNLQVSQALMTQGSGESLRCILDVAGQKIFKFSNNGKNYRLKCLGSKKETHDGQEFNAFEFFLEEFELTQHQKVGNLTFTLNHDNQGWQADDNVYDFGNISPTEDILFSARKTPDSILHLSIMGPGGHTFEMLHDISSHTGELKTVVTWKGNAVKLFLNAVLVEEITLVEI